jgi:DNA polymerase sigma
LLQAAAAEGEQVDHLGAMLLSFLQRFGSDFNPATHAVAVKHGGIVERRALDKVFVGSLALQDPLTGAEGGLVAGDATVCSCLACCAAASCMRVRRSTCVPV